MPANIGVTGFIFIIVIALILFGPNKLPELGRAFGSTLKEVKKGAQEVMNVSNDANESKNKAVKSSKDSLDNISK